MKYEELELELTLLKKSITDVFIKCNDLNCRVKLINEIREHLNQYSPFKNEPVDFVKWERQDNVVANDYNPNKVAPPEMELLEVSIMNDGYTQPIVTWANDEGKTEVIDGFHRNRVGKESKVVGERIKGYLPVVNIRKSQSGKNDRIASTIRHNRARGKHQVDAMSEIVIELKNRNWSNNRIAKQLGMDEEEVLRLCQISGLEHLFSDRDFSNAWVAEDDQSDIYYPINDKLGPIEIQQYRAGNTNDPNRIFHTYDKWECHKAGFYKSNVPGKSTEELENEYKDFLSNDDKFEEGLNGVLSDWKHSCEHYLSNKAMNRVAWLGQAAMCYSTGVPSKYCAGFNLLTEQQKEHANNIALKYLNKWLVDNNRDQVSYEEGLSIGRQVELY
jgi:hypothetical protein